VKDVAHNDNIYNFFFHRSFHSYLDLVQSKKFYDQGIAILLHVLIVVLEDVFQVMELSAAHRLQCKLPIRSVIEEGTTFTCAR